MTVSTPPTEPHRTLGEKIDDASVTALVKAVLLVHLSTSAIDTKVQTREGVVTVSGVAGSAAERKQVTNLASDIHGVNKVVNEMSIKEK
ncbi:MAG: BON domain-containing protein [Verrucomicrobiota bacterium]